MKHSLISSALSFSLLTLGCIDEKDIGIGDETGGASSSSSGNEITSASGGSTSTGGTTGTTSASDTSAGSTSVATISGTATDAGESSSGDTSGTAESSGGSGGDQELCESTGGVWDPAACGHYVCGLPQECQAVIPGCDCGLSNNFEVKVGCFPAADCAPVEFACGESTCSAPAEYCDVYMPGVKGAPITYDCASTPEECEVDYTCDCLTEGLDELKTDCTVADDLSITVTVAGA